MSSLKAIHNYNQTIDRLPLAQSNTSTGIENFNATNSKFKDLIKNFDRSVNDISKISEVVDKIDIKNSSTPFSKIIPDSINKFTKNMSAAEQTIRDVNNHGGSIVDLKTVLDTITMTLRKMTMIRDKAVEAWNKVSEWGI